MNNNIIQKQTKMHKRAKKIITKKNDYFLNLKFLTYNFGMKIKKKLRFFQFIKHVFFYFE